MRDVGRLRELVHGDCMKSVDVELGLEGYGQLTTLLLHFGNSIDTKTILEKVPGSESFWSRTKNRDELKAGVREFDSVPRERAQDGEETTFI